MKKSDKKFKITFGEFKKDYNNNDKRIIIPVIQRNYKWGMGTATVLGRDLIELYMDEKDEKREKNLGLLTLYETDLEKQILDGQQRIISLTLFESQIKKLCGKKIELCFEFERDRYIAYDYSREKCIEECLGCNNFFSCEKLNIKEFYNTELQTDWERMLRNYMSMIFPITINELVEWYQENFDKSYLKGKWEKIAKFYCLRRKTDSLSLIEKRIIIALKKNCIIEKYLQNFKTSSLSRTESFEADCIMEELYKIKFKVGLYKYLFEKKQDFAHEKMLKYLDEKVSFYYNISKNEPIAEFLNINQYKTPFVVYDYAKAQMIIETKDDQKREKILKMFAEIAGILYGNTRCWNLVKKGYDGENITSYDREKNERYKNITSWESGDDYCKKKYTYGWENSENRMKILFVDRYENAQLNNFDVEAERKLLSFFKKILEQMDNAEKKENGEFIYSALEHLYNFNGNTFFSILEKYQKSKKYQKSNPTIDEIAKSEDIKWLSQDIDETTKSEDIKWLPRIITNEINSMESNEKSSWKINYFFDGLMHNKEYVNLELDKIVYETTPISEEWGKIDTRDTGETRDTRVDWTLINTIFNMWKPNYGEEKDE